MYHSLPDGGATFDKPVRIDEGETIGRVDIAMLGSDKAMVSWMEGSKIKARVVHKDGMIDKSIEVANSSGTRSSGFPQMTKAGDQLIFAWTDDQDKNIKVSSLSISKL
ncbi:MAG: hypothetical protein IPJ20_14795 [Flammeovirgaceae bacterium]|nr:hypothetical protein [Flammeovirgaceae bacterium]